MTSLLSLCMKELEFLPVCVCVKLKAWVGRERRYSWGKWWKKSKLLAFSWIHWKGAYRDFCWNIEIFPLPPSCKSWLQISCFKEGTKPSSAGRDLTSCTSIRLLCAWQTKKSSPRFAWSKNCSISLRKCREKVLIGPFPRGLIWKHLANLQRNWK